MLYPDGYIQLKDRSKDIIISGGENISSIEVEEVLPPEPKAKYPRCVEGKRACPPEDCGGPWGYPEFLEAIQNPKHEEHEEMLEWLGGKYDPQTFSPGKVKFDNPVKRWKAAFS